MIRLIFIISFSAISNCALAQQKAQIEIKPFIKFDKYPEFSYVFRGRPSTDYVKIKGTSFGLNLAYKIPFSKSIIVKPGIGFYRYSFNNIDKENTIFGKSHARNINFQSPIDILFYTDKYRYNTISANIGFEKVVNCNRNIQVIIGLNWNNYYAVSEFYHLIYNPAGSQDYRRNNKRYFGSSVYTNVSLLKKFQKISIGPSLILPVFDNWKKDKIFPEETNSGSRSKWLNGIGLGISFNYSINKEK